MLRISQTAKANATTATVRSPAWPGPSRPGHTVSAARFPRRRPPRALTLMDRALFRDLGSLADDFMRQVRSLPHFRPAWNDREVRSGKTRTRVFLSHSRARTNMSMTVGLGGLSQTCVFFWPRPRQTSPRVIRQGRWVNATAAMFVRPKSQRPFQHLQECVLEGCSYCLNLIPLVRGLAPWQRGPTNTSFFSR